MPLPPPRRNYPWIIQAGEQLRAIFNRYERTYRSDMRKVENQLAARVREYSTTHPQESDLVYEAVENQLGVTVDQLGMNMIVKGWEKQLRANAIKIHVKGYGKFADITGIVPPLIVLAGFGAAIAVALGLFDPFIIPLISEVVPQ